MATPANAAPDDLLLPLHLELRHLRLVLAIAETGGVGRAGERLHLTQSALSHQLREIEHRLGVALFDRVRNRLVLTEAGARVLESARRVLADVVALESELLERDPSILDPDDAEVSHYPGGHAEGFPDAFKQLALSFYGWIARGGAGPAPFPTFADGHHEVQLCEAIARSARAGGTWEAVAS